MSTPRSPSQRKQMLSEVNGQPNWLSGKMQIKHKMDLQLDALSFYSRFPMLESPCVFIFSLLSDRVICVCRKHDYASCHHLQRSYFQRWARTLPLRPEQKSESSSILFFTMKGRISSHCSWTFYWEFVHNNAKLSTLSNAVFKLDLPLNILAYSSVVYEID